MNNYEKSVKRLQDTWAWASRNPFMKELVLKDIHENLSCFVQLVGDGKFIFTANDPTAVFNAAKRFSAGFSNSKRERENVLLHYLFTATTNICSPESFIQNEQSMAAGQVASCVLSNFDSIRNDI